jgi:hypothetical protein
MNEAKGLSEKDKERFANVRNRAENLGVLDISFNGAESADSLDCYEHTLDIIEKNKSVLDQISDGSLDEYADALSEKILEALER